MMFSKMTRSTALALLIFFGLVAPSLGVNYAKVEYYSNSARCTAGTPYLHYKWLINDNTCIKDPSNTGTSAESYKITTTSFKFYTDGACSTGEVDVTAVDTCTQLLSSGYYIKVKSFDTPFVNNGGQLMWSAYSAAASNSTCDERLGTFNPHGVCIDSGDGSATMKMTCTSATVGSFQAYSDMACATTSGAATTSTITNGCTVHDDGAAVESAGMQTCTIPPATDSGSHAAPSWVLVAGLAVFSQAIALLA